MLGVLSAFIVVGMVLGGVAYALGRTNLFTRFIGQTHSTPLPTTPALGAATPVALAPTIPPAPSATPIAKATPLPQPTVTAIPATLIPSTPALTYATTTDPQGIWWINAPSDAQVTPGSYPILGVQTSDDQFSLADGASLTIYDLAAPVSATQAQGMLDTIASAEGITAITIIQQPRQITIGTNSWSETLISGNLQGQVMESELLYAPYGQGAIAINSLAPQSSFATTNQQQFLPMEQSFTYSQR